MSRQGQVVRFGVFEVDLAARELRKRGVQIKLQRFEAAVCPRPSDRGSFASIPTKSHGRKPMDG